MSDVVPLRILARIEEEAATWVWRLDDEAVSAELRAEFAQWVARDPRHRRAFEELGGVWVSLGAMAEAAPAKLPTAAEPAPPPSTRNAQPKPAAQSAPVTRPARRRLLPWAIAATLVLAAGAGSVAWLQRGIEAQLLATAVGQRHTATLADGSVVQLNTNTILETDFGRERVIRMRKGEAAFRVAHDPQRPFLVQAGDIVVRAVGTQFNVRVRDARDVEVIVTEGKVDVRPATPRTPVPQDQGGAGTPFATASRLVAGQRYEAADRAALIAAVAPAALTKALAWREGAIVFDGDPLNQAIAELNRYSDTRLVVADAQLNDLRVGGRFRAGDVEGFLSALTRTFPVSARRGSDDVVYLQARGAGEGAVR